MPAFAAVQTPTRIVLAAVLVAFAVPVELVRSSDQSPPPALAASAAVEQTAPGARPALAVLESFDGLGHGFSVPQGPGGTPPRNPSDNSLAVGPDHIMQIVNSQLAVFSKKGRRYEATGKPLYGPIPTNTLFTNFGDVCGSRPNGDAVVRYDQLAERWLVVMPIFRRAVVRSGAAPPPGVAARSGEPAWPGQASDPGPAVPPGPPPPLPKPPAAGTAPAGSSSRSASYAICYALSVSADPLGPYHRYVFERPLFPDYPRPAVWPDGYDVPTSTGDDVIQKHTCIVDRAKMLKGLPATEQCLVINDVNFLNNADLDGTALPPAGAPNIMMAAGGTQLAHVLDDAAIPVWQVHVDWERPINTHVSGPQTINVGSPAGLPAVNARRAPPPYGA